MNSSAKNKKAIFLVGIILLILCIGSVVYWGQKKQIWFCDEIYTYESANGFEQQWPHEITNTWMTGKDIEKYFSADLNEFRFNDISIRLYCDHVPLYFWIFRFISVIFFPGSGSVWIGLWINLIFYCIATGIIYAAYIKVTKNVYVSGVLTFLSGIVSRLLIEQMTSIRMYMMLFCLELELLVIGFSFAKGVEGIKQYAEKHIILYVISTMGFLCHYDFWIFYAATSSVMCLVLLMNALGREKGKLWKIKEFVIVVNWGINFVISLLTTVFVFPYCRWNLNRGKGETALNSVFVFSKEKVSHLLWGIRRISQSIFGDRISWAFGIAIIIAIIVSGCLILEKREEKENRKVLLITIGIALLYHFIVCFTLPDIEEERYLWGSLTILMLCLFWCAWLCLSVIMKSDLLKNKKFFQGIVYLLVCTLILVGETRVIDKGKGVAYLFHEKKDTKVLEEYYDIPWVVYGPIVGVYSYYDWLIPNQICFLTLEESEEKKASIQNLKQNDKFILYIYEDYLDSAKEIIENELGQEFAVSYLMTSTNLTVFIVEKSRN